MVSEQALNYRQQQCLFHRPSSCFLCFFFSPFFFFLFFFIYSFYSYLLLLFVMATLNLHPAITALPTAAKMNSNNSYFPLTISLPPILKRFPTLEISAKKGTFVRPNKVPNRKPRREPDCPHCPGFVARGLELQAHKNLHRVKAIYRGRIIHPMILEDEKYENLSLTQVAWWELVKRFKKKRGYTDNALKEWYKGVIKELKRQKRI